MREIIGKRLEESSRLIREIEHQAGQLIKAGQMIAESFSSEGRLFVFGNGGSAAHAQHLAAKFVNRFLIERPPLPALALTTDTSVLTSISSDYHFNDVFSKQIKALGRSGDVALALTTSNNSINVVNGLIAARSNGLNTIVFTGGDSEETGLLADLHLAVPTNETPRIQEIHIIMGHVICELVDYILFQKPGEAASP